MKAIWNDTVIVVSNDIVNVEGTSFYYNLDVHGKLNPDAVRYYPEPGEEAKGIKGRVAFWKSVKAVND
jgi:uncharacterized protein (DUF427 family)